MSIKQSKIQVIIHPKWKTGHHWPLVYLLSICFLNRKEVILKNVAIQTVSDSHWLKKYFFQTMEVNGDPQLYQNLYSYI